MILDVRGSQAAKKVIQLGTPLEAQNTVQLKYFRFPPMPLVPEFVDAISCDGQTFTVDPQTSLAGLAHYLQQLRLEDESELFFAFYDESANLFEIVNRQSVSIAFSIEFAGYLMFETIFPANAAWEIGLSEKVIDQYTHYAVTVKNVKGSYDGRDYDEVVGRVYRDGVIETVPHNLRNTTRRLDVEVRAVRLNGESEPYSTTIEWGLGLEIL